MAQIYRDDLKRNWTLTEVRIFQDERDNNNMETSNSSITPRIIYMEQEVRGRWSFRTCKYIEGIECHCVLTVFVLYNLSLSLFLFFSPFYSRSPSLEASCHRGQCDTSPFRPVPWLYSRYPRHNAHSVALPAWKRTDRAMAANLLLSSIRSKRIRRDEKFDWPVVIIFKIWRGGLMEFWKFLS